MDLHSLDDRALVNRAQRGEREAFSALVVRYQERVLNLAYRRLGDHEAAMDLTQDVFLKAFRALDRFQGEARFFTWIYRITLNEASSAWRKRARRPDPRSLDAPPSPHEDAPRLDPVDPTPGPDARASSADTAELVQAAILDLPDDQAQALLLRDIEGLSYQEVADTLQIPVGSVKSRLHRARLALKGVLSLQLSERAG